MNKSPSLLKILAIDYTAFQAWLFPVVIWILYFINRAENTAVLVNIWIATTLAALAILIWRIQLIYSVFGDGVEIEATIHNKFFFRGRGRVEYIYTYQGVKYISSNRVLGTKKTRALAVGAQTVVLVDRDHAKRAFIRDLYT